MRCRWKVVLLFLIALPLALTYTGFQWKARVRRLEVAQKRAERERQRRLFVERPERDWPTVRGGLDMSGWTNELLQPPLHKAWETKLPFGEKSTPSDPIVYKGRVYVTVCIPGGRTALHALDAWDGRLLWTGSLGQEKPSDEASPPGAGCGIISYASLRYHATFENPQTVGHLYAFDALSGSFKWKQEFHDEMRLSQIPIPPIILPSGLVCYVRINGPWWELAARKVEDGALVWSRRFAGSPVNLGPYTEGTLYVTSYVSGIVDWEHRFWDGARYDRYRQKSTLTALNGRTGRILWSSRFLRLEPGGWGDPGSKIEACGRDRILFGTSSGSVVAFDPRSRRWLWHRQLSEPGYAVPVTVAGNLVISARALFGSRDFEGPFSAFEGVSGKRLWKRELSPYFWETSYRRPGAPVVTGDILYAFGENHTVAAIVQTGEVIWDCYEEYCQAGGGFINVAVSKGRMFYAGGNLVRSLEGAQHQGAH